MIRNIIWDVDGTLFDTYPAIVKAFRLAVNSLGEDVSSDLIMRAARQSLGHCVSVLATNCRLKEDDIENKFNEFYASTTCLEQPPFPGVIKICQSICSQNGKNVIVTHRGRQGLVELLAAHQMTAYFSGWIARDDGYPKKPNPDAFEAIIKIHGLKKEETLAVGDREIDIQAGKRAGVSTCLFDPEGSESTADYSIPSFDRLYNLLYMTA